MPLSAALIRGIRYRNPTWPELRLEAVSMGAFWRRVDGPRVRCLRRPDFHHLFLCTAGEGRHLLDFQPAEVVPGTVVHVRPGQVHAFGWNAGMDGVLLMFAPEAWLPEPPRLKVRWPPCLRLEGDERIGAEEGFRHLLAEYGRTDGGARSALAMRHLLAALLLQLGGLADRHAVPAAAAPARLALFRLFEEDVERRFLRTRLVADYARRLGYAERTLVRAVREAGGMTPKAFIAARVLLEAKRLLAHTDLGIGSIAVHLGFSETTNFTKFFRKGAGVSPETFRIQASSEPPDAAG